MDAFVFDFDGVSFGGFIGGGAGVDTLDYSAFTTTPVAVDLGAGTATGTTGIADIEDVIGGALGEVNHAPVVDADPAAAVDESHA
ncbi:MAG: hypothetical protein ACREOR_10635, partial [Candidatus Binatia bacterium]